MCAKLQLSAKYLIKTNAKLDKKRKFWYLFLHFFLSASAKKWLDNKLLYPLAILRFSQYFVFETLKWFGNSNKLWGNSKTKYFVLHVMTEFSFTCDE